MKKINCNINQWLIQIIFDIVFIVIFIFFIKKITFDYRGFDLGTKILIPIIMMIFFIGIILFLIQIMFFPFGLIINEFEKKIIIKYLLLGSRTILTNDIDSYYTTQIKTKSSNYYGVLIQLKNKQLILCSDFNLKDYKPVIEFLEKSIVPFTGNEKFNYKNYYLHCLK